MDRRCFLGEYPVSLGEAGMKLLLDGDTSTLKLLSISSPAVSSFFSFIVTTLFF